MIDLPEIGYAQTFTANEASVKSPLRICCAQSKMAATISGVFPVCLDQQQSSVEDAEMKKKQLALMEKLRNKRSSQHRSWTESLKSIRTAVVDRRLQADSTERSQVQKCLDTLQRAMKVISQQSLVERLESVARQQALTFHFAAGEQPSVTLQADMFYIEVIMNKGGGVREVKVAHQGDASVCHELTEILSRGDFAEFTSHLEGLQSIYKVTGEKKLKSKAYLALQSLERDLNQLAQFQNSISGVANYIHKSPLGILLPRTAGKPMKLIYFVSPYDLLDKKTLSAHPMTVEAITEHGLGRSVTVCLEPGPPSKLQTMPLLMVSKTADSKSLPSFSAWNHMNSATLPAIFTLVLPQPIPVAASVLQKIKSLTELDVAKDTGSLSLLSLILDSNSDGKMKKDQRLFVSLPDQHHVYFINSVAGGPLEEPGVMVSRIPFTHPTHVPAILNLLRQQLLFNSILASCVRPSAKKDPSCCLVFEMTVISLQQLMVVFEHPAYDTMVTVDVDLSDITSLKCRLLCTGSEHNLCPDDFAARVLQRCLSLPILFWALVRRGRGQLEKLMEAAKLLALEQARRAREAAEWAAQMRQQPRVQPTTIPTKGRPPPPQPPPSRTPSYPPTPSPVTSNPPSVGTMGDLRGLVGGVDLLGSSPPGYNMATMGPGGDSMDKLNNPLLANLLDERGRSSPISVNASASTASISESPMLSKLLEDNISVATNINPIPIPPMQQKGNKRVRKRRSQSEIQAGRSPKRMASDGDASERLTSVDLESSSSPFESSLGSGGMVMFPHHMGGAHHRPPSQGHMSGVIDLTDENMPESSLKKLVDSVDSFMHKESKPGGMTSESELTALLNEAESACSPALLRNNQSTGPKNENASTSPEGVLAGSGEVGKASSSDPLAAHTHVHASVGMGGAKARSLSHNSPSTLASFLGHGQARPPRRDVMEAGLQPGSALKQQLQQLPPDFHHHHPLPHPRQVSPITVGISATSQPISRPKVVSSGSMTDMMDIKPVITNKKGGLKLSNSTDSVLDKRSSMGLFEKFDFTGQSLTNLTASSGNVGSVASAFESEDAVAPKVRLKLTHPFRTPHGKSQSLDSAVVQSPSSAGSKSSNSNTFDFRSDEEDDDPPMPMNYVPSAERLSVYASSPTRLQISSKGKPPTPVTTPEDSPSIKPEKYKRKEKGSGSSTKRKKDRDDAKREKKKKKLEQMSIYQTKSTEPVYRTATIEGDQKSGTKLKIRVSKEHIKTPSPPVSKESSKIDRMSERVEKLTEKINDVAKKRSSSPIVEKLVLSKQDIRDHSSLQEVGRERTDQQQVYRSALASSGKSPKSGSGKGVGNSALSKSDPKLAKATIRLKPLNMAATTSTSVTLTPTAKTTSNSRGADRQRSQSLASVPVSTPTSGTLSLSSILPNAPTASSVASLPPIPKLSASSNATSTSASSANKTVSSTGNTAVGKNSSATVSSSLSNASPKVSGSVSVSGSGGRTPNTPNATVKTSPSFTGAGANKISATGGVQRSPGMGGQMHRNINTSVGQKPSVAGQRMSSPANMSGGTQKNNTPNQYPGAQRMPNASNQTGGQHRGPSQFNQGGPQRPGGVMNQGANPQRTSSVQGSGVSPKVNSSNQAAGVQKTASGSQMKVSNIPNQAGLVKAPGVHGQNAGFHKGSGVQGTPSHKPGVGGGQTGSGNLNRTSSGSQSNLVQKNSTTGSSGQKIPGSATPSPGANQGQKLPGNQGRSLPPNAGRGAVRNNSVSGASGRTPPNHLPINRTMSTPGQRSSAGSSPRTPAGQSPSTPSAPNFPNSSPQRGVGSSPNSISQRSSSSTQAGSGQKTPSSSQSNAGGQRQMGGVQALTSHRPAPSPQSSQRHSSNSGSSPSQRLSSNPGSSPGQRPSNNPGSSPGQRASNNPGSSPNQRPSSTPSAGDARGGTAAGQSPGHQARPSSAGPRQSSSPMASRTSSPSSAGQRLNSSPSRTASPLGHKTNSGNSMGTPSSISPLVRSLSSSGGRNSPTWSRQNSSGSLTAPQVSRQNSSGRASSGSGTNSVASHQTASSGSSMTSDAKQPSHSVSSSGNVNRSNLSSSGSSVHNVTPSARQVSTGHSVSSSSTANTSSVRQHSTNTVASGAASRPSSTSDASSSASPINSSSASKSAVSGAATNKSTAKTVPSGISRSVSASGVVSNKIAGSSNKVTANTSVGKSATPASTSIGRSLSVSSVSSATSSAASSVSAASTKPSALLTTTTSAVPSAITKPAPSTAIVSSVSQASTTSSSVPTTVASSSKTVTAPRGRKGSLSAIVNKLATRVSAVSGSGPEGAESASDNGGGMDEGSDPQKVSAAGQARRRSAADGEGERLDADAGRLASAKAPAKRTASMSSLSPPSVEHKLQRMDSFGKSSSSSTPPTIPSPAHSTPPQHFIATPTTPTILSAADKGTRSSTGERSNTSAVLLETEDMGLDLSMPKDKPRQDTPQSVPRPDPRDKSVPKDSSAKDISHSMVTSQLSTVPAGTDKPSMVVSGTKFNGDSSRDKPRAETEVFKVPTPKPQAGEEGDDRGGVGDSRGVSTTHQTPASPVSDASSPGNDLVIDCGESPSLNPSRPPSSAAVSTPPSLPVQPSPKRVADLASEGGGVSSMLAGYGRNSPVVSASKAAPSPTFKIAKSSPMPSPVPKASSRHNSPLPSPPPPKETSTNSPCEIDDELMDAALMGFEGS